MLSACEPDTSMIFSFRVLVELEDCTLDACCAWGGLGHIAHGRVVLAYLSQPCTRCSWLHRCMTLQQRCWLTIKHKKCLQNTDVAQ